MTQPPVVPPSRPRPRRRAGALAAGAAAIALVAGGVGGVTGAVVAHREDAATSSDAAKGSLEAVAERALPSVVTIRIADSSGKPIGTGSGFVLRADGYIVTNYHVAKAPGSDQLKVLFQDGSQIDASVAGADSSYDLAVLKVDRKGLIPLLLGDSRALQVGAPVVAVGAPLGLQGSVTSGIVSALNRPVITKGGGSGGDDSGGSGDSGNSDAETSDAAYLDAIQTDAAINHGNSGGPLLNLQGQVVGVNTAIASATENGGSIGLGFAIPANQVRRTTDQLIRKGQADHPVIGISFDTEYAGEGVKVTQVQTGGPAAQAGIKPDDVITKIDGQNVRGTADFIVALRSKAVGSRVTLMVVSESREHLVSVVTAASGK
ncbi:PDZ domain-containing protein [Calidifontibacter sp. DB0510]|uniref:PDZ domain-containing protein n=1 Tax=Metallococcus carri TaxID=1656884 RepID=A0A967E9L2_9MICO|nr:trypsin-like peptidase domain-containing protein [Metallococcus carri]NHN56507.1 PDZ domain-containing protein [Metallococcus carri]NOP36131.1 PDZ domain-containing protein [Calidifontibacter sp. DB2511S]